MCRTPAVTEDQIAKKLDMLIEQLEHCTGCQTSASRLIESIKADVAQLERA